MLLKPSTVVASMVISYSQAKVVYTKYERFLIPAMLVFGFLFDLITFKTLNIRTAFFILGVQASIVAVCIVFLQAFDDGQHTKKYTKWLYYMRAIAPLLLQFSMGALLSAVMIFYLFSGALSVSWPFYIMIAFLMLSNELFRDYYLQPKVQLTVYYLVLFALVALVLPFWIKYINVFVFALAGLLAMALIYVLYRVLRLLVPAISQEEPVLIILIGLSFGGMLGLYLTNIIPPIPLSVRAIGVYHEVTSVRDAYVVTAEVEPWQERLIPGQTMRIVRGAPLFVYSAIFAPSQLQTNIVHIWEWYDEEQREWKTMDTLGFRISGGRDDGFRGFTQKSSLLEGEWRVSVATVRGQVLGRVSFHIEYTDVAVPTVQFES